MDGFDDTPELPAGLPPAPASDEGGAPAAEAPEIEYVSLKNRDEEVRMTRATAQAAADELGITVDEFVKRNQIGWDGTRLYNQFEEYRERELAALEAEKRRIQAERGGARTPAAPAAVPAGPTPTMRPRPNPQDVVATIQWMGDRIEAIEARGGTPSDELKSMLADYMERLDEKEKANERSEERVYANQCYEDIRNEWKKEYGKLGIEPPSQREMWNYLRRMPLHQDPDRTWHEIWKDIALALRGPALVRAARRQAAADLTKPDARVLVPAGNRAGGPVPKIPSTGSDEQDIAALEQALSGVTGAALLPGLRE